MHRELPPVGSRGRTNRATVEMPCRVRVQLPPKEWSWIKWMSSNISTSTRLDFESAHFLRSNNNRSRYPDRDDGFGLHGGCVTMDDGACDAPVPLTFVTDGIQQGVESCGHWFPAPAHHRDGVGMPQQPHDHVPTLVRRRFVGKAIRRRDQNGR